MVSAATDRAAVGVRGPAGVSSLMSPVVSSAPSDIVDGEDEQQEKTEGAVYYIII